MSGLAVAAVRAQDMLGSLFGRGSWKLLQRPDSGSRAATAAAVTANRF